MHWNNRRGYSLAEMAVVLTISGLILAMATPSLIKQLNRQRVRDAAEVLRDEMRMARQRAVTNGTRNYVYTQWGTNSAQYWTGVRTFNEATKTWSAYVWRGPIDLPSNTKQINANFSSYIYFYFDPAGRARQPTEPAWPQVSPPASGSVRIISTNPAITDTSVVNLDLTGNVW